MPPPVPSPFLKSVASLAHHPSIPFLQPPRLFNQNLNLTTKTLGPTRANLPLSFGGGGSSFFPLNRPYWSGWINRGSMPAVRAVGPTKGGFGFGFGSDSNLVKRGERQGAGDRAEAMGTDADSGLDPVSRVGEGEVVNGFCHKNTAPPRLLTLPTVLTLGRVAAVPLLISTFYMEGPWGTTATTSIFLLAAITDWLDGYIARKMQLGTAFGAFLDPVADKLMVAATLVLLCTRPFEVPLLAAVPWLLPVPSIAIIGREITMSAVREWAASQDKKLLEAVAVNNLGKWKTAAQMTALTILLLIRDPSLTGQTTLVASGVALLYVSAGLAVWSLVVYMKKIWKVLIK
ncbi:CDP-diacylglycerol--glycerol-3-phosphate 3-phosphatidyltransferase [Carex littledalei]|uniref:CDP-diacylglycerol--glycerol-3-phosphate 3-phosphatidyltransferase n=1 Tax=Carex littledalei TaxID=544730 RepID=A0A833R2E7_9POAL|nr:CDP-diacylglycerol--glycerol-3-phosphate 3-phosphatidyltransferase [Carex littledalei]